MSRITRYIVGAAALTAVVGCAPDAPPLPFALASGTVTSTSEVGTTLVEGARVNSAARTIQLEVGRSATFDVPDRQYTRFVRFKTSDATVASVSSTGVILALKAGTSTVSATLGGTTEQVQVVVNAPPVEAPKVVSFTISPKYGAAIAAGATYPFSATAKWTDNAPRAVGATFHATGGTVSTMGHYTAGPSAGLFLVVATCVCGLADTAYVRVGSAPVQLASLKISPKSVALAPEAMQQFTSKVVWSTGDTTPPARSYWASGGSVSATGAYKAPATPGTYQVIVSHTGGTLKDTAIVTVTGTAPNPDAAPPPTPPLPEDPPPTLPPAPPYTGSFGPGPNAPAWSNKRTYPEELFNAPIPVHYSGENAAGFKGWQGFDGAWGIKYASTRVTYPTAATPIGTKRVLQITHPGSTTNIAGSNQTTNAWPASEEWAVRVTGQWSGTLIFEKSINGGVSWNPVTLRGTYTQHALAKSGTSVSSNGVWAADKEATTLAAIFRVRASAWSSGTATVAVGIRGGEAAARMSAGWFEDSPTRVYTRVLVFVSANWTNGGNTGTKFFFYSQEQGNNHYTAIAPQTENEMNATPFVGLQGSSFRNITSNKLGPQKGQWLDVEYVFIANQAGQQNGIVKIWVNGVQYMDVGNVMFFAQGTTPRFPGFFMDPTYGGGEAPPPRNVYFQIAGWYRESAR